MLTKKLKLVSLSGIKANKAVFLSPNFDNSNSSVKTIFDKLSRLNFSSLADRVICIDFNVLAEPE